MIYDGLNAIGLYKGLYKGLDVLIDWLKDNDPYELPVGKHEICGDKVFANVMNASTRTVENARYEVHHRYMDLQLDIEGREAFRTTPGEVVPNEPFDEVTDKGYCHVAEGNVNELEGNLDHGRFAIFVIDEPHMPNLVCDGDEVGPIKKICFKIIGDQFWED